MHSARSWKRSPGTRLARPTSQAAALAAVVGLAGGGTFAAVTAVAGASSTTTATAPTATAPSTMAASAPTGAAPGYRWSGAPGSFGGPHGFTGPHGFGDPGGFGGPGGIGGPGGGGTITAIEGTTLTLRTEAGTETVRTASSTVYTKEHETIGSRQLRLGDIVRVAGSRRSAAESTPGTGTVTAARVDVVLPELSGRVTSIRTGVYTVVGPDGQILTVTSGRGTRYYGGTAEATAASVTVGSLIVAEGRQDSLTHLRADTVSVVPAGGPGGGWTVRDHRGV